MIVAHALTESTVDDATVGIDLIGAAAGGIASVMGDAAYDTVAFSGVTSRGFGGVHLQIASCTNAQDHQCRWSPPRPASACQSHANWRLAPRHRAKNAFTDLR